MISQIPDGFLDIDSDNDVEPAVSTSAIFPDVPIHPAAFSSAIPAVPFSSADTAPRTSGTPSREQILAALKVCSGHRAKTAKYLGISRRSLQYKIKEYHISSRCHYDENETG